MTLVPINSTLNRVMIKELALSATLVAVLASLPYLFSPLQVLIGSYSDHHPVLRLRRTPYIFIGLLLCVLGVTLSPLAAFQLAENLGPGLLFSALAFGAWGMGYNLSSVSYLSLASEISGEKERGKTIAAMWFIMIVSIIFTAIAISRMVEPYSPQALQNAFNAVGLTALVLGGMGLLGLEAPSAGAAPQAETFSLRQIRQVIGKSPQAVLFFWYLTLLLAAILGQDVLLEPFAAEAFGMSVQQTTRITSLWGGSVLAAILLAGALERILPRKVVAQSGNLTALGGFLLIIFSALTASSAWFYTGVILLGAGTGISSVSNLALMFDLTLPGYVGLFIGAWGVSNALSRLLGTLLAGLVRDAAALLTHAPLTAYLLVFGLEATLLALAAFLLLRIDAGKFQQQVQPPSTLERAALSE